jgi:NAD(P)-dependent dehydrogenase (short-subunit alcohol dehydrogenase family)
VAINYFNSAGAAEETAAEVRAFGVDALPVQCDVSDPAQVHEMAQVIERHFGGVDILVNSASHFGRTPFPTDDPAIHDEWRKVTRILIDGPWYLCNALVPAMQDRGGGVIVNIADLAAEQPWRGFAAHGVGKAALLAFTRQLAIELAPTIRANAVVPGYILPPPAHSEQRIQQAAQRTLLGRIGSPSDAAHAVKYLIEADFVTGEVLYVDGGERLSR